MADRTVMVKLQADTSQYQSGMRNAAKSTTDMDKASQQAQQNSQRWQTVGRVAQVAGVAAAVGMYKAAQAASNQEQAMGSLQAVFQSSSPVMEKYAKDAVNIGLSQADYAQSAAVLGAQLKNLGVDQADLGTTTNNLMNSAADMAAQFGGTTQDAVDALSAAFRGERDPIERYGVTLTETNIKAEMAATGLDKTAATMSLLNKQLAQTGTTGAAAREFDTMQASTQRLAATFANAQAELGQALMPAMTAAANAATTVLEAFNSLPGPIQAVITALGAVGTVGLLAAPKIISLVQAFNQLSSDSLMAAGNAGKFAAKMGVIGGVMVAAKTGIDMFNNALLDSLGSVADTDLERLDRQMYAFATTTEGTLPPLGNLGDGLLLVKEQMHQLDDNAIQGVFSNMFNPAAEENLGRLREQLDLIDDNLVNWLNNGEAERTDEFARRLYEAYGQDSYGTFEEFAAAVLPRYASAAGDAANATMQSAEASRADEQAKKAQAQAVQALINDLNQLMQLNLAIMGSENALAGQTQRLTAARKQNGTSLSMNTEAGRANRDAMLSELGTISQVVSAQQKKNEVTMGASAAARVASSQTARLTADFMANATAAGFNKQQLAGMVAQALDIPKDVAMKIATKGADMSKRELMELIRESLKLDGTDPTVDTDTDAAATGKIIGKATGEAKTLAKQRPNVRTSTDALTTGRKIEGTTSAAKDLDRQSPDVETGSNAPTVTGWLQATKGAAQDVDRQSPNVPVSSNASSMIGVFGSVANAVRNIPSYHRVEINYVKTGASGGGGGGSWATGGHITGQGTATSDSIPALLSNGEYVQRAASVDKYGLGFMHALNQGVIDPRELPRYRTGGKAKRRKSSDPVGKFQREQRRKISGMPWADERWRDYNPVPTISAKPAKRSAPTKRRGESKSDFARRLKDFRRDEKERLNDWKRARRDTAKDWDETIAREQLDYKWGIRDSLIREAEEREQKMRDAIIKQAEEKKKQQEDWAKAIADAMKAEQDAFNGAVEDAVKEHEAMVERARSAYEQIQNERDQYANQVASSASSAMALSGMVDWDAEQRALQELERAVQETAQAVESLADAQDNLAASQVGLNEARAAAREDVADSRKALRDARREAARDVLDAESQLFDARLKANTAAPEARAEALREVKEAERELAETRLDGLESVREAEAALAKAEADGAKGEAEALQRIADARRDVAAARAREAAARRAEAAAERAAQDAVPTPEKLLKQYQQQAAVVRKFREGVQQLTGRGLHDDVLREIGAMAPEQGVQYMELLRGMNDQQLQQLNRTRNYANREAALAGKILGDQFYAGDVADAWRGLQDAKAAPIQIAPIQFNGGQPIQINLDARRVWNAVLDLQRRGGNTLQFAIPR